MSELTGSAGTVSCGSCAFVDARNLNDVFCRRYPASIVVVREKGADRVKTFYPNVHPMLDWCGEYSRSS